LFETVFCVESIRLALNSTHWVQWITGYTGLSPVLTPNLTIVISIHDYHG